MQDSGPKFKEVCVGGGRGTMAMLGSRTGHGVLPQQLVEVEALHAIALVEMDIVWVVRSPSQSGEASTCGRSTTCQSAGSVASGWSGRTRSSTRRHAPSAKCTRWGSIGCMCHAFFSGQHHAHAHWVTLVAFEKPN
jgi:hypothetical protein